MPTIMEKMPIISMSRALLLSFRCMSALLLPLPLCIIKYFYHIHPAFEDNTTNKFTDRSLSFSNIHYLQLMIGKQCYLNYNVVAIIIVNSLHYFSMSGEIETRK